MGEVGFGFGFFTFSHASFRSHLPRISIFLSFPSSHSPGTWNLPPFAFLSLSRHFVCHWIRFSSRQSFFASFGVRDTGRNQLGRKGLWGKGEKKGASERQRNQGRGVKRRSRWPLARLVWRGE